MDTNIKSRREVVAGLGVAALGLFGWAAWHGSQPLLELGRPSKPRAGHIPNPTVYDQDGKAFKFYDDLIHNKVVVINMAYAQCAESCPTTLANMVQVQKLLGERAGRDIFMYTITLAPELDTPKILKAYAEGFGVKSGWLFLTGVPADIEALRIGLGFYDVDPIIDADRTQHANMVRIGDAGRDRWTMSPGLARPEQILSTINHVDRSIKLTSAIHVGHA